MLIAFGGSKPRPIIRLAFMTMTLIVMINNINGRVLIKMGMIKSYHAHLFYQNKKIILNNPFILNNLLMPLPVYQHYQYRWQGLVRSGVHVHWQEQQTVHRCLQSLSSSHESSSAHE